MVKEEEDEEEEEEEGEWGNNNKEVRKREKDNRDCTPVKEKTPLSHLYISSSSDRTGYLCMVD